AGSALSFITFGTGRSAGRIDNVGCARICEGNIRHQQTKLSAAAQRGCMTESYQRGAGPTIAAVAEIPLSSELVNKQRIHFDPARVSSGCSMDKRNEEPDNQRETGLWLFIYSPWYCTVSDARRTLSRASISIDSDTDGRQNGRQIYFRP